MLNLRPTKFWFILEFSIFVASVSLGVETTSTNQSQVAILKEKKFVKTQPRLIKNSWQ